MTASFSDEILGARATHEVQASEIRAMNVKYEQINTKLDTLIQASAQPAAAAVYEVPKEPRQEPQRR